MDRVLITGGAGFIGSNASNILSEAGLRVIAFDSLLLGKPEYLSGKVEFVPGDCMSRDDLERVGPIDHIIHLAGFSSAPMFSRQLAEGLQNNIVGYANVLEFARQREVRKVLFASTSSIYGNNDIPLTEKQPVWPPNFYAVSKHSLEHLSRVYHQTYGTEIVGFRFMSVYGPNEEHKGRFANVASQFIWGIEQGKQPLIYGDGSQTRDFTNVRDIVHALMLTLRTPRSFGFRIFNVGTGIATNLVELVSVINDVMQTNVLPRFIENPAKMGYVGEQCADLSEIKGGIDYAPSVNLRDGIREIVLSRQFKRIAPSSLSF